MRRSTRSTEPSVPSPGYRRAINDTPSSLTQRQPLTGSGRTLGLGQRFTIATAEFCSRIMARDNEATVRWVPAHPTVAGNEKADELAKAANSRSAPSEEIPDERRKQRRRVRKEVAGCYYKLLSKHAATGFYPRDKIHRIDSDECWWCDSSERQSRHLFVRCKAWAPQRERMWRDRKACRWKHPRAPSARLC